MTRYLIRNVTLCQNQELQSCDIRIEPPFVTDIGKGLPVRDVDEIIEASGYYAFPGGIDVHVHFREPWKHSSEGELKATIESESRAAVAGGITSYCEMPNTVPPTISRQNWEEKMAIARQRSYANYSFYIGASPRKESVLDEMDATLYSGVKVYMTSHDPSLLMDEEEWLRRWFQKKPPLVVVHAEDHVEIEQHLEVARQWARVTGGRIDPEVHIDIRGRFACLKATERITAMAMEYNAPLHIAHVTTKEEVAYLSTLFNSHPKITAEVCSPHLFFNRRDYQKHGNWIKVNPSIKEKEDQEALWGWLYEEERVCVSTDHAPHTYNEKLGDYFSVPSGIPSIQWIFPLLLTKVHEDRAPLWMVPEWLAHRPARFFGIEKRGEVKPGFFADLVLIKPLEEPVRIGDLPTYWMPKWNPFADFFIRYRVEHTWVSGNLVYSCGKFKRYESFALHFSR